MAEPAHSPFRGVFEAFAELNRMREHWTQVEATPEQRSHASAWVPLMDIFASGDDLIIRCELAGVTKDEVAVSLSDGQLWISGQRSDDPREGNVSYYVRERRYGPFRRSINLPGETRPEQLTATFSDGLLEIRVGGVTQPPDHATIDIGGAESADARLEVSPKA